MSDEQILQSIGQLREKVKKKQENTLAIIRTKKEDEQRNNIFNESLVELINIQLQLLLQQQNGSKKTQLFQIQNWHEIRKNTEKLEKQLFDHFDSQCQDCKNPCYDCNYCNFQTICQRIFCDVSCIKDRKYQCCLRQYFSDQVTSFCCLPCLLWNCLINQANGNCCKCCRCDCTCCCRRCGCQCKCNCYKCACCDCCFQKEWFVKRLQYKIYERYLGLIRE